VKKREALKRERLEKQLPTEMGDLSQEGGSLVSRSKGLSFGS